MGNSGLWVAVLTAVTAIAASWVTSRGNTQAARVQALAAADAQHLATLRASQREAYLAFIEQINTMGIHYRETPAILEITDADERRTALVSHLAEIREAYGLFLRQLSVVTLDGPRAPRAAADAVDASSTTVYKTLLAISEGSQPTEAFAPTVVAYWETATDFVHAAREARDGQ